LGPYGTPESRHEYARVIAEWEANGRRLLLTPAVADVTVNEMILAYWKFAVEYYRKNGEPPSQQDRIRLALKPVREHYGHTAAKNFGPLALKVVREWMVKQTWTRGYVNSSVGCIKRMFKWAVENELVPASIYHGLQAVSGLKKGRCEARETKPIRPVADEHVDAILPFLNAAQRAMVQLQRFTGMRPGEVCIMRPCDLDCSNTKTWIYRPESHKTEHHDIERIVFLGPRAQDVLKPFLFRDPGGVLFFAAGDDGFTLGGPPSKAQDKGAAPPALPEETPAQKAPGNTLHGEFIRTRRRQSLQEGGREGPRGARGGSQGTSVDPSLAPESAAPREGYRNPPRSRPGRGSRGAWPSDTGSDRSLRRTGRE
jgi:integrase